MTELTDEERRALKLLARSPDGCTEALMMAHGFTTKVFECLVRQGLATAAPKTVYAGSRRYRTIVWMWITDTGRQAVA
jgi:hypothetical protein